VIPAAGSGQRFGAAGNKLLEPLAGQPLLLHTLHAVAAAGLDQVVLVCREGERPAMSDLAQRAGLAVTLAPGGATRQESVANGLAALRPEIELVAVHDGARPLVAPELFAAALASAERHGSGVVALPVADTLKRVDDGLIVGTLDRAGVWAMQTPQAFAVETLRRAAKQAAAEGFEATDEAMLVERYAPPVRVVEGSARNFKITRPQDLLLAQALLGVMTTSEQAIVTPRIGFGYDIHQLVEGRELWLGGVQLDSPLGLLGHSDADALLHAICDALLGAIGAGDIGRHFPDTDPAYRGIASLKLLAHVHGLLTDAGWRVVNVDATVVAERPKLAPYVPEMVRRIAATLGVEPGCVNLKATTNEQLDDIGAARGICAHAVAAVAPCERSPLERQIQNADPD
jgi:2-C-methyl-D-erythritol 4-phosphate cytidylyltransferase/2-C-methyl-D-erythritol 2,4-cyclodiphosphate synthase